MNLAQAFKMAAKSISGNKGRSALTMLGVIIGLAAVIILVSYAQGQNMALRAFYESMGSNTISLYAYSYGNSGPQDVGKIIYDYCLQLDDVLGVSPRGYVYSSPTIKYESKTLTRETGGGAFLWGKQLLFPGRYATLILSQEKGVEGMTVLTGKANG